MRQAAYFMAPVLIVLIGLDLAFLDPKPPARYLFEVELVFVTSSYAWFLWRSWRHRQAKRQLDQTLNGIFAQCAQPLDEEIKEHIRNHPDRALFALVWMFSLPDEFFANEQTDQQDEHGHGDRGPRG